jgi:hypothetical protein
LAFFFHNQIDLNRKGKKKD